MTSQLFSAAHLFEKQVIADIGKTLGRKPTSADVFENMVAAISTAIGKGDLSRTLVSQTRLAIKASPYAPQIPALVEIHNKTLRTIIEQKMPALFTIIRACRELSLPIPVILSCEKYLPTALALQKNYEKIYGIAPLIVRGDTNATEENFDMPVLTLPVADSYEALPVKVFETLLFFQALDDRCGLIKIDDDLKPTPNFAFDPKMGSALFAYADYLGVPVGHIFHDRIWHSGKCQTPTPTFYGKPLKSTWARGALYFLSHHAMEKLAHYYMRFPACLDGECYEDKAVGDILHDNNIILTQHVLEQALGLDSATQVERG